MLSEMLVASSATGRAATATFASGAVMVESNVTADP